jgi:hypothetical protein
MKILSSILAAVSLIVLLEVVAEAALTDGLVLYFTFEGQDDTVIDLSKEHNDGTSKGATRIKEGKIGSAMQFDKGEYVEVPHSKSLSITEKITVMAWVNMRLGASGELAIVSKGQWAANDLPYELTVTPGGVIYWQFYDNAGRDSCSAPAPPVDEWHHIAGTYDGEIFKVYVDGEMKKEWAYKGKMPENTAAVTIGRRSKSGDCLFDGQIDEVAIFNRALTQKEIQEAMQGISTAVGLKGKLANTWGSIKRVQ